MSSINGVGNSNPVQKITSQPIQKSIAPDAPKPLPATDKVELSGVGQFLKSLKANDVRADKVAEMRKAIESDDYMDDHKLDVATDRLLDDLLK